jgi:antitoxin (DNA-binding transcriptional repressor) of toxin-antitoxin stability system
VRKKSARENYRVAFLSFLSIIRMFRNLRNMSMKVIASADVQKNFGVVADWVAAGESVRVTRYGRGAFLIVPETEETSQMARKLAGRRMMRHLKTSPRSAEAAKLTQDQINEMIDASFA